MFKAANFLIFCPKNIFLFDTNAFRRSSPKIPNFKFAPLVTLQKIPKTPHNFVLFQTLSRPSLKMLGYFDPVLADESFIEPRDWFHSKQMPILTFFNTFCWVYLLYVRQNNLFSPKFGRLSSNTECYNFPNDRNRFRFGLTKSVLGLVVKELFRPQVHAAFAESA